MGEIRYPLSFLVELICGRPLLNLEANFKEWQHFAMWGIEKNEWKIWENVAEFEQKK